MDDLSSGGGDLRRPAVGEPARQPRLELVGFFGLFNHRRVLAVGLMRGNPLEFVMPGFMPGIHVFTVTQ